MIAQGLLKICNINCLHKHFEIIHAENAANSGLPDLVAVQQLELLRALIEIIAKRHAVPPLLYFTAFRPQLDVDGVTCLEHLAQGGYVN